MQFNSCEFGMFAGGGLSLLIGEIVHKAHKNGALRSVTSTCFTLLYTNVRELKALVMAVTFKHYK